MSRLVLVLAALLATSSVAAQTCPLTFVSPAPSPSGLFDSAVAIVGDTDGDGETDVAVEPSLRSGTQPSR